MEETVAVLPLSVENEPFPTCIVLAVHAPPTAVEKVITFMTAVEADVRT